MRTVCLSLFLFSACSCDYVIAKPYTNAVVITELAPELSHDSWIDFNKNGQQDTFENPEASVESRVEDLLAQMTVDEKTCQLVTLYGYGRVSEDDLPTPAWQNEVWKDGLANIDEHINGVAGFQGRQESQYIWPPSQHVRSLNEVQRWFIEETRLGIPVDFTNEGIRGICHHKATNFPAQVGVGATWDKSLVTEIGRVTGEEGYALGYTTVYSPILDLPQIRVGDALSSAMVRIPTWSQRWECYKPRHYRRPGLLPHRNTLPSTACPKVVAMVAQERTHTSLPEKCDRCTLSLSNVWFAKRKFWES